MSSLPEVYLVLTDNGRVFQLKHNGEAHGVIRMYLGISAEYSHRKTINYPTVTYYGYYDRWATLTWAPNMEEL